MFDSVIRTVVPLIVGALIAWAAKIGLNLPEGAVTELVTVLVVAGYYVIARLIETRWPALGRILLAAGLSKRQPVYTTALGHKTPRE